MPRREKLICLINARFFVRKTGKKERKMKINVHYANALFIKYKDKDITVGDVEVLYVQLALKIKQEFAMSIRIYTKFVTNVILS